MRGRPRIGASAGLWTWEIFPLPRRASITVRLGSWISRA